MFHPLTGRYPGKDMKTLFPLDDFRVNPSFEMDRIYSEETKFGLWADCEIYLAESELELGLSQVKPEYVAALRQAKQQLSIAAIKEIEKRKKHDVMSFVEHYAKLADAIEPDAGGIIHLGATSCYVTDNSELIQQRAALSVIHAKLRGLQVAVAQSHDAEALLSYAVSEVGYRKDSMLARGAKGTTGTQASYMELFDGDYSRVCSLDRLVTEKMGFAGSYALTGQTYPRVADFYMLSTLGVVAKCLEPLLDARLRYLDEPRSAIEEDLEAAAERDLVKGMKKNELAALLANVVSSAEMASSQWLERSLDDSSHRRLLLADSFIALDRIIEYLSAAAVDKVPAPRENSVKPEGRKLDGMVVLQAEAVNVVNRIHGFALEHRDSRCLAYTHYQVAQPTTYGKRLDLWAQNYILAVGELERAFHSVAGRTLPEEVSDYRIGSAIAGVAIASAKKANDMRLLQHEGELAEPFDVEQKGSSAMPHKRNPMKQERVNGLSRYAISAFSALDMEPLFLTVDSILQLDLATYVRDTPKQKGFTIFEPIVERNLRENLPYLAAEPVMMMAAKKGGDRQKLHERLRLCAIAARENVVSGNGNNMLELMRKDGFDIPPDLEQRLLNPNFHVGAAPLQVDMFERDVMRPFLEKYRTFISDKDSEVKV
ncbi:hypothetical protein KY363_04340 [Candidatus Woesearchaeota archaeon]|nr:hypothetical protein [Candidatus Woesearchaeota archaeon]